MFTGLIEAKAEVVAFGGTEPKRLEIECALSGPQVSIGDSIALNGCCLTVVTIDGNRLGFDVATETIHRTAFGHVEIGHEMNVERALRAGQALDGHLVTGHVDALGTVVEVRASPGGTYVTVEVPADLAPMIAPQGSVTLSGVSLTVTDMQENRFTVCLIPHTLEVTNLHTLASGASVHVEVDIIARYVYRMMGSLTPAA